MSEEAAFLTAIAAALDDNAVRLVYADWLEGNGRPGAVFLRTECELASIPLGQPRWHEVFARYRAAGAGLPDGWCAAAGRHPMSYWLAASARSAWARLEGWCQLYHPQLLSVLNPGASAEQVDAVERAIGQSLPPDVRESFAIHNGADWFLFGNDMLTTTSLVDHWRVWRGVEEYNEEFRDGMKSYPEGAVAHEYTIPGWIPLTADGGGNHLGVDLTPGPAGTFGQVINFGRDEEHKCVLASGWAEFLADYATFLESSGVSVLDPNPSAWGDFSQSPLGDRHHHDVLREWRQQGRWPLRRSPDQSLQM
jgi:uncharacterized protein (TIGR02996 family)